MHRLVRACLLVLPLLGLSGPALAQSYQAEGVLKRATEAMGDPATLRYGGSGRAWAFGQAWQPGGAWPQQTLAAYTRLVDYPAAAFREDIVRSRAEPNGGSPLPLSGEQRISQLLAGTYAWNLAGPLPAPLLPAVTQRMHELWTTPHGVLRAAARNQAALRFTGAAGRQLAVLSFTEPGRFSVTATLNEQYQVERVESRLPNPVLGEVSSVITYSGYRDWNGVQFPARIAQSIDGQPVFELEVNEVQAGVPAAIEAPEGVRQAVERIGVEKVAEGIWYLTGGSHHSVAIALKDQTVVVESPLYDGRAQLVLDAAAKLAGKPVGTVINSHPHFDHAGGLRTAAASGASVLVHAQARPYLARALAGPSRVAPDALARSGKAVRVLGAPARHLISDGTRSIEVHAIADSIHATAFLMVYLPAEKLLIEADAYTPLPPGARPPSPHNHNHLNLVANIERLGLQVDRILPLHGRIVPYAELLRMVGRTP
jgi:glyoxylase-like metal-dependent hydrolase (beta-lactamase superfamily II)